jgi:hypothetical protein
MSAALDRFTTLLDKYGLGDEFIACLHEVDAIVWGSAAVHCCLEQPSWEPADLDILVSNQEKANNLSNCLTEAGYDAGIKTTVSDTALMEYDIDVPVPFADSIDAVIVHQQWRCGVVQVIHGLPPMEVHGRVRRVIKIYIGRPEDALAASDLNICMSRIEFNGGSTDVRDMTAGHAATLLPSLFDLSTEDMRRLGKWRARGFIISGFE